ncbi:MAG: thioredoxin-disulfide reductase [Candidatus Wallbacteria bacterium]|nr:thioredoxin-disulfide reductase [Candidatus Wallbacteria bacterium]
MPGDAFELVIIGGGPAGLTSGLYASRSRLNVLLLEKTAPGGMAGMTAEIENYPGVLKTGGFDLVQIMEKQCREFGCLIESGEVTSLEWRNGRFHIACADRVIQAQAVVMATGTKYRRLDAPGEADLIGRGVSFCATCDAPFYRGREVAVIGGGNTACEEALYLTRFASRVHLIHRRREFRATRVVQERLNTNDKMRLVLDTIVERVTGKNGVDGLDLKNVNTGEQSHLPVDGVFVFIGLLPNSNLVKGMADLTADGFIKTDQRMRTSRVGLFAAGDVRETALRQVVTAAGDGAVAAFSAEEYLKSVSK